MYFFFLLSRLLLLLLLSSVAASQSFLTSFRLSRLGNESPGLQMEGKDLCKRRRRLASQYYPSSEAAPPVFTYFQWLQLAEKVLSQFFLANVTLWGSHANAAWVARPSYKHYSSLSQLSSFSSLLYSSRPTRQQLPALCIAARSFVHRLSSLQQ